MAIKKTFNGATILKPGGYSRLNTANTAGSSTISTDTVFLIGESSKGAPGSSTGILDFNAANLDQLIATFGSGPIVDAALAARSPSNSPGINGAGRYLVYKTNASSQASLTSEGIKFDDLAFGAGGNAKTITIQAGTTGNQRLISVKNELGQSEVLGENQAQSIISVEYTGDADPATITISGASRNALVLTTALTAPSDGSANLNIPLANLTIQQLADQINAAAGYTAIVSGPSQSIRPATDLDVVTAVDITSALVLRRLKQEIIDLVNTSSQISATETVMTPTLPTAGILALTGGAKGASTNASFAAGLSASLGETYNILVPCISRDATADISDTVLGFTDAGSTYTISAVLSAVSAHLALRGNTKNRKEAQAICGIRDTKDNSFALAQTLGDSNIQLCMQDMVFNDATGNSVVGQPHVLAAALAGIRAGTSVGEPLTHKYVRSIVIGHLLNPVTLLPTGTFNSGTDADDAILAGITFTEKANGGNRVVVDNTTYGIDESFIFNRGSVLEAAYFVNKTLRQTVEDIFIGKKVSNGLAGSIKNIVRNKLRELNAPEIQIITSSDGAPEGFREDTFVVTVTGNTARVQVDYCPVQGLDFLFLDFTVSDIIQSA